MTYNDLSDKLLVFSEELMVFRTKIIRLIRHILKTEAMISSTERYFLKGRFRYPINVVLFEHKEGLGYFDSKLFEIGINKMFLFQSEELLINILRHEIAHCITYIDFGNSETSHGNNFKTVCNIYGWDVESAATIKLDTLEYDQKKSILSKIRKLLDLSSSKNIHESELAILKAKELLTKHQLDDQKISNSNEFVVKRILEKSKTSQLIRTISSILRQFFVRTVINHGKNCIYMEIFGSKTNVCAAEYIALFLDKKLESLWAEQRAKSGLPGGTVAKNSFIKGIESGFLHKQSQNDVSNQTLIKMSGALESAMHLAYPSLKNTKYKAGVNDKFYNMGKQVGKNLEISTPIENSDDKTYLIGNQ